MPGTNLTAAEARTRAQLITAVAYRIDLDLTNASKGQTFRSTTVIRFACTVPGSRSFADLVAEKVHEIVLNGVALEPGRVFADSRIELPTLSADNELRVVADCAYSTTGEGLHRFADPVDGETYLYTQFELPDARRVFASFEQPDIKGMFQFTAVTPAGWTVISNEVSPEPEKGEAEGTQVHRFAATPPIPTYIAALIAGPYAGVSGSYQGDGGQRVPLAVYCRRSLVEHLDAEAIFAVTRQGFDYFQDKFGIRYPFSKFDQIFLPAFNAEGMENAGAVTIHDEDLFRSKVTERRYQNRADTILHELAHMWFGNLVTMKWWDDLWLNESFATFMSVLCQAEARGSQWTNAWTIFTESMKSKAYEQDQLPSTHPIVADISDLAEALVNLDAITYEKGASVLKQLVAYVGQDAFFAGVRAYMRRHAWGNTRLSDLLDALERASGRDLRKWSKLWLETAGVNVLRPEISLAGDGTLSSIEIRQEALALAAGARGQPVLRPHRIAVGMYDLVDGAMVRTGRIEVDVDGELTRVPVRPGRRRPAVVLLNDDDLSYAKVRLDPDSLAAVTSHIADFTESLPRALCWALAWDMTRDGELAARDYLALALEAVGREREIGVVESVQRQLKLALDLYADPGWRAEGLARYAARALELVHRAAPGSDHQLAWARAFAGTARTGEHLAVLRGWLAGDNLIAGLAVDDELRWELLEHLSAAGAIAAAAVDAELERDNTAAGQRHHATCMAARPTARAKADAWTSVVELDIVTNSIQEGVITGFVQPDQGELLAPYTGKYFAAIKDIFEQRSAQMSQQIILRLYPSVQVETATLDATDAWLSSADPVPALRRMVLEGRAGVERALRARAADRAAAERR